ncbi:MAG: hypothetical protein ABSE73_01300 [Planctomycetota bacterium]
MATLAEIQKAIRALPESEFEALSSWFDQYDEERWQRRFEASQPQLSHLAREVRKEIAQGRAKPMDLDSL